MDLRWTVLIPAKALPAAKSRLAGATGDVAAHAQLVRAIRADTIAAVLATTAVARVLLVVDVTSEDDRDSGVAVFVQSTTGLNGGLEEAAEHALREWPDDGVAALVADLPALRPAELEAVLRDAAGVARGYVADRDATGTTLLTARPGTRLQPGFGPGSAARHAIRAAALDAGPTVRQDVDTPADLDRATLLGVGERTSALVRSAELPSVPTC